MITKPFPSSASSAEHARYLLARRLASVAENYADSLHEAASGAFTWSRHVEAGMLAELDETFRQAEQIFDGDMTAEGIVTVVAELGFAPDDGYATRRIAELETQRDDGNDYGPDQARELAALTGTPVSLPGSGRHDQPKAPSW